MRILKIIANPRVVTAVISALGAIISACCAGCRLAFGEMSFKDFEAEIFSSYNTITNQMEVINVTH